MLETLAMWSDVQLQLRPHPNCMKISKLGNHIEGSRRRIDGFSNLVDQRRGSVAHEFRALVKVHDSAGFESHQTRAGCIGSHRIVRQHNLPQGKRSAVEGAVAFHGHNAVCDDEARIGTVAYRPIVGDHTRTQQNAANAYPSEPEAAVSIPSRD
jgi:hypothetical protein